MPYPIRLTALAIARALLAGPAEPHGLAERLRSCLDADAPWQGPFVARCAALPIDDWQRLTPRTLADFIEHDSGYQRAWRTDPTRRPTVRRFLMGEPPGMSPGPRALAGIDRPDLPHATALAQWLGVPMGGLWRLTRPAGWQRRAPLVDQHYDCQLLPKPRGGWRLLEAPRPWLMPLQRRLLDDLLARVPPHEAAFGHRRDRSVVDHARRHAGQAVVMTFDLTDFFTTVRAARIHALFTTLGYPDGVAHDLAALSTTATPEPVLQRLHAEGGLAWQQVQRLRDPHLPQGAPSSPALADLCAFGLDLRLDRLARRLGARYSRYVDDLVLSGPPALRVARARIEAWVGRIAREEGFALNHRKTRCLDEGRRQAVCGIVVNRHANLARPAFDRLKAILHQCALHGAASQNREGHPQWRDHLRGRVAWAAQVNPAKAVRLQRLFDRIDWDR